MARLPILEYPDPRLRIRAERVTVVDDDVKRLVEDMFETMYSAPGIGLAATQVDVHKRVIVIDVSEARDQPYCFINPEILSADGRESFEEGCLSVPGLYEFVERAERIKVRALDKNGEPFELEADGLLAQCIQHEMDHLEGKLFVDYLSPLKRERLKKRYLKKARREAVPAGAHSL
ncbi:MAG TPA: peptide deformylase [Gammaproteobacteria bacterium]